MRRVRNQLNPRAAQPAILTVYDGTRALGEIEDHGRGDVRAWIGIGDERSAIGTFRDRKAAMRAVSDAADATQAALKQLSEPVGFVSELPTDFLRRAR